MAVDFCLSKATRKARPPLIEHMSDLFFLLLTSCDDRFHNADNMTFNVGSSLADCSFDSYAIVTDGFC